MTVGILTESLGLSRIIGWDELLLWEAATTALGVGCVLSESF